MTISTRRREKGKIVWESRQRERETRRERIMIARSIFDEA